MNSHTLTLLVTALYVCAILALMWCSSRRE